MTTPALHKVSTDVVYAMEEAANQHGRAMLRAKQEWRAATHPMRKPTPEAIERANERYRIAYNAALRVYLAAVREIDDWS